jgi:hypothetical protein
MSVIADLALGAVMGALTAAAHLWLLWRTLARLAPISPAAAGARLARGLPLRLLIWAPGCLLAAQLGLFGCLGLIAGSLAMRWCVAARTLRRSPTAVARN